MSFRQPPRAVIVDASVAISLLQGNANWVDRWSDWVESGAIVLAPAHFAAEVANALLRSLRLPAAEVGLHLDRLFRSGVEAVDRQLPGLLEAVALADQHRLTVYDALYLQLALDVGGQLATLDVDLARAAEVEDVELI
ncbi:MAG: type II toxin-antitoxin system VapC family toxin [Chloroflexota bacterium]|nr:type II toxin-antitoxin system VapC family toxin [Chloroflexota bacterium]